MFDYFCIPLHILTLKRLLRAEAVEGGIHLWKGVYLTLCSLALQSLANLNPSESKATVDVHWGYVFIHHNKRLQFCRCLSVYTYSAWASALLVLDGLGNARRLEEWDE